MKLAITIALIATLSASAQTDQWPQLSQRLQPGDRIQVQEKSGTKSEGTFVRTSDSEITLSAEGKEIGVGRTQIRHVKARRSSARVRNALIGTAIGGGAAAIAALAISNRYGDGPFPPEIIAGAIALGAGIGLAIGLGGSGYKTVYSAPRH